MRKVIAAVLLSAAVSSPSLGQSTASWFMASPEGNGCRSVQTPSERVLALRAAGDRGARALPYRPPGAATDSEPTRFSVRTGAGDIETFFRTRADCEASNPSPPRTPGEIWIIVNPSAPRGQECLSSSGEFGGATTPETIARFMTRNLPGTSMSMRRVDEGLVLIEDRGGMMENRMLLARTRELCLLALAFLR